MEIKILPNQVINAEKNESLLEALTRNQLPVDNVCNGRGTCGKCKVRIIGNLPAPSSQDLKHLTEVELQAGFRLACTVVPQEGMSVELNFVESQDRKESALLGLKIAVLAPRVEKISLTVNKPSLQDERGDWDRVIDALSAATGKSYQQPSLYVLRKVTQVMRAEDYVLTLTIFDDEIIEIESGDTAKRLYGVGVDIGTTSVGAALYDLSGGDLLKVVSVENEQTAYGADVISRISFAKENQKNAQALRKAAERTVNYLLKELEAKTDVKKHEIVKMTIVGNTTMHHLLLGLNVAHLAVSPFVSASNIPLEFFAQDLGIDINPQARVFLLPNIGSFVGADTMGAIVGAPQVLEPGNHLLIDLGTNCELFLKTDTTMLACSTAAGPAFEGAGITYGMRAKQGAIEGITITDKGVECKVIGDQEAVGICGSGLIEAIDEMIKSGVINKQGKIAVPETAADLSPELKKRIRTTDKSREFILAYGSEHRSDVTINQKDIGELQLAKGAVCAGIKTLAKMSGISVADLDSIILSGTFATYLKAENILNIGLVPDIPSEKIKMVGNAAHVGAIRTLLDYHELEKAEDLYRKISHIELGGSATFSNYFMNSLYLERLS